MPGTRRAFVAQLAAGAGLAALGGCHCRSSPEAPPQLAATLPVPPTASAPPDPPPSFDATLAGAVLTLRYRYSRAFAERFRGPPWAATLVVAIHPPSLSPACRNLTSGALRTEAPALDQGVFKAAAEVDLESLFGLQAPFVRHVHASFLHLCSGVLRAARG